MPATIRLPMSRTQHEARHAELARASHKRPLEIDDDDDDYEPDLSMLDPRLADAIRAMGERHKRQRVCHDMCSSQGFANRRTRFDDWRGS
jgi:predicted secreted Zn-dependent protease